MLSTVFLKDSCVDECVFERLLCCRKCFRKTPVLSTLFLNDLVLMKVLLKDSCVVESAFEFLKDSCVIESVVERLLCCRKCCGKTLVLSKVLSKDSCVVESVFERQVVLF